MTTQIAVRLPDDVLARLDQLVADGTYQSRAAAVRAGIDAVTDLARREAIDRAIVEGYRRTPQTEAEEQAALAYLRETIAQEPW